MEKGKKERTGYEDQYGTKPPRSGAQQQNNQPNNGTARAKTFGGPDEKQRNAEKNKKSRTPAPGGRSVQTPVINNGKHLGKAGRGLGRSRDVTLRIGRMKGSGYEETEETPRVWQYKEGDWQEGHLSRA